MNEWRLVSVIMPELYGQLTSPDTLHNCLLKLNKMGLDGIVIEDINIIQKPDNGGHITEVYAKTRRRLKP